MSGPTHPWDQPEDPRESTINLPRIVDGSPDRPEPPARPQSDRASWQGRTIRPPAGPPPDSQDRSEPLPGSNGDNGLYRMRPVTGDQSSGFFDPLGSRGPERNGSADPTAGYRWPGRAADQFSAWQPPANGAGLDRGPDVRPADHRQPADHRHADSRPTEYPATGGQQNGSRAAAGQPDGLPSDKQAGLQTGNGAAAGRAAARWAPADRPAATEDQPAAEGRDQTDVAADSGEAVGLDAAPDGVTAEDPAAPVAAPATDEPAEQSSGIVASPPAGPAPDQAATARQDRQALADQQVAAARQIPPDYRTAAPDQRPRRGSLADLRRRLLQLPDGHPSSHFEDGGARKPPPPRIRHYELPLTEGEREVEPARAGGAAGPTGNWAGTGGRSGGERAAAPSGRSLPEDSSVTDRRSGEVASRPSGAPAPARGQLTDGITTSERTRPGKAAEALDGSNGPADLALTRPASADREPAEVRPAAARLTPEQERIADHVLSDCRTAEGRRHSGGYGQSGLTPAITRLADQLSHGWLAPDSEQQVLKSAERFKQKLARLIARHPDTPVDELAADICDTIRYAFVFEPEHYSDVTWQVHRRLSAGGFELEARRNRWESPESKGIRSRWRDPAHDVTFEVQFHTPASWDVQQQTFAAYLQVTDPATPTAERATLRARQVAAAAAAKPPPGWTEIADFRADFR